jgi:hypothetical protein
VDKVQNGSTHYSLQKCSVKMSFLTMTEKACQMHKKESDAGFFNYEGVVFAT